MAGDDPERGARARRWRRAGDGGALAHHLAARHPRELRTVPSRWSGVWSSDEGGTARARALWARAVGAATSMFGGGPRGVFGQGEDDGVWVDLGLSPQKAAAAASFEASLGRAARRSAAAAAAAAVRPSDGAKPGAALRRRAPRPAWCDDAHVFAAAAAVPARFRDGAYDPPREREAYTLSPAPPDPPPREYEAARARAAKLRAELGELRARADWARGTVTRDMDAARREAERSRAARATLNAHRLADARADFSNPRGAHARRERERERERTRLAAMAARDSREDAYFRSVVGDCEGGGESDSEGARPGIPSETRAVVAQVVAPAGEHGECDSLSSGGSDAAGWQEGRWRARHGQAYGADSPGCSREQLLGGSPPPEDAREAMGEPARGWGAPVPAANPKKGRKNGAKRRAKPKATKRTVGVAATHDYFPRERDFGPRGTGTGGTFDGARTAQERHERERYKGARRQDPPVAQPAAARTRKPARASGARTPPKRKGPNRGGSEGGSASEGHMRSRASRSRLCALPAEARGRVRRRRGSAGSAKVGAPPVPPADVAFERVHSAGDKKKVDAAYLSALYARADEMAVKAAQAAKEAAEAAAELHALELAGNRSACADASEKAAQQDVPDGDVMVSSPEASQDGGSSGEATNVEVHVCADDGDTTDTPGAKVALGPGKGRLLLVKEASILGTRAKPHLRLHGEPGCDVDSTGGESRPKSSALSAKLTSGVNTRSCPSLRALAGRAYASCLHNAASLDALHPESVAAMLSEVAIDCRVLFLALEAGLEELVVDDLLQLIEVMPRMWAVERHGEHTSENESGEAEESWGECGDLARRGRHSRRQRRLEIEVPDYFAEESPAGPVLAVTSWLQCIADAPALRRLCLRSREEDHRCAPLLNFILAHCAAAPTCVDGAEVDAAARSGVWLTRSGIKRLEVEHFDTVTPKVLEPVLWLSTLRELRLSHLPALDDAFVRSICLRMPQLRVFDLDFLAITDGAFRDNALARMSSLDELSVRACPYVTLREPTFRWKCLSRLKTLRLDPPGGDAKFTVSLNEVANVNKFTRLRVLELGCDVSRAASGVERLDLRVYDLSSLRVLGLYLPASQIIWPDIASWNPKVRPWCARWPRARPSRAVPRVLTQRGLQHVLPRVPSNSCAHCAYWRSVACSRRGVCMRTPRWRSFAWRTPSPCHTRTCR